MKKILATLLGMAVGVTLVNAQGWMSFTGGSAGVTTNSNSFYNQSAGGAITGKVGTLAQVGVFYYALLVSTTPITDGPTDGGWAQPDINTTTTAIMGTNGTLQQGTIQGPATGQFQSTLTAGTSYYSEVVAWSASLGNNWTTVEGELAGNSGQGAWNAFGYFGYEYSGSADLTPASASPGVTVFPTVFANSTLVLYTVAPTPVPEPATLALAGLGGLSMLMLRRRKA